MKDFNIKLDTIIDIKNFIALISMIPNLVYAKQYKYIVNAKSGMGLYSLDLSNPILIEVSGDLNPAYEYEFRKFEVQTNNEIYRYKGV